MPLFERTIDKVVTDNSKVIEALQNRVAELEEIVKAVAHIGVDFGYGKYELEAGKILNADICCHDKNTI